MILERIIASQLSLLITRRLTTIKTVKTIKTNPRMAVARKAAAAKAAARRRNRSAAVFVVGGAKQFAMCIPSPT